MEFPLRMYQQNIFTPYTLESDKTISSRNEQVSSDLDQLDYDNRAKVSGHIFVTFIHSVHHNLDSEFYIRIICCRIRALTKYYF